uniref:C2H2-type domain-containing protein n=1 Tax=Tetranychus urticae TaxID=32264 RepID=T1KVU7_TETUR
MEFWQFSISGNCFNYDPPLPSIYSIFNETNGFTGSIYENEMPHDRTSTLIGADHLNSSNTNFAPHHIDLDNCHHSHHHHHHQNQQYSSSDVVVAPQFNHQLLTDTGYHTHHHHQHYSATTTTTDGVTSSQYNHQFLSDFGSHGQQYFTEDGPHQYFAHEGFEIKFSEIMQNAAVANNINNGGNSEQNFNSVEGSLINCLNGFSGSTSETICIPTLSSSSPSSANPLIALPGPSSLSSGSSENQTVSSSSVKPNGANSCSTGTKTRRKKKEPVEYVILDVNSAGDEKTEFIKYVGKGSYKCQICDIYSKNNKDYIQDHINIKHYNIKKNYQCLLCNITFAWRSGAFKHLKKYHSIEGKNTINFFKAISKRHVYHSQRKRK